MNVTYTIIEEPNIISAPTVRPSCLRKGVNLLGKAGYLQMQRFCLHSSIHWIWLTVFSGTGKWYRLGTSARPEKGLSCSNVPNNTSLLPAFINTISMTHYFLQEPENNIGPTRKKIKLLKSSAYYHPIACTLPAICWGWLCSQWKIRQEEPDPLVHICLSWEKGWGAQEN